MSSSHRALLVAFAVTGVVSASWASRLPDVQHHLGLSVGRLSLVILAIEGGAVAGLTLGGLLVRRYGSRCGLWVGMMCFPLLLTVLPYAPSLPWLVICASAWAVVNSVQDVAMNAAGVELEGGSQLSGLHAGQSVGLLIGGGVAVAATSFGVGPGPHFVAIAVIAVAAGCLALRWMPASIAADAGCKADRSASANGRGIDRRLLVLGAIAFCGFLVEGGGANWAAVDVRRQSSATPTLAASAYTAMVIATAGVRWYGDRMVTRLGRQRVVQVSGLVAAAGTVVAVTAPGPAVAIVGWAAVGAGVALLAPTILAAAGPPAGAIATVSTMGYLGSFTGPALIGTLATHTGLSPALTTLTAAALIAALLARRIH